MAAGSDLERFVQAGQAAQSAVDKIIATADELAGITWWNALTPAQRARALVDAGWKSGGTYSSPSAADAWAHYKQRVERVRLLLEAGVRKRCTCGSGLGDGLCPNCWPQ